MAYYRDFEKPDGSTVPDFKLEKHEHYLGNPNVKRADVDHQYSEDQLTEYMKCAQDPIYFAENYVKIVSLDDGLIPFKLYDYQKRLIKCFQDNRYSIALQCRQSGKCLDFKTRINIRNKKTGEIVQTTIGNLYECQKQKQQLNAQSAVKALPNTTLECTSKSTTVKTRKNTKSSTASKSRKHKRKRKK